MIYYEHRVLHTIFKTLGQFPRYSLWVHNMHAGVVISFCFVFCITRETLWSISQDTMREDPVMSTFFFINVHAIQVNSRALCEDSHCMTED